MAARDVLPVQGLHPELGLLLAMFEDGTREWREELGEVDEETVVRQAFPNGHSIGAVLMHIADVELWWIQEVAAGRPVSAEDEERLLANQTDQDAVKWPAPPRQPLAWYYEQLDEIRARTERIVRELKDPEHIARRDNGREYTLRWILHHVITHEAYHGGQAVLLSLLPGSGG